MSAPSDFELDTMAAAHGYQRWMIEAVRPHLGRRILEIGAGTGNMTRHLPVGERLIATEPDPRFLEALRCNLSPSPAVTVAAFDPLHDDAMQFADERIDTVVSFNVLEHVEEDGRVLSNLSDLLRAPRDNPTPRRLVTLVPAHGWAYGAMDRSVGHVRRYGPSRIRSLARRCASDASLSIRHFNPIGLLGWVVRGRLLRRDTVGEGSVAAVEWSLPALRGFDRLLVGRLGLPLGQSVIFTLTFR